MLAGALGVSSRAVAAEPGATASVPRDVPLHPLDPLTAKEIAQAVEIIRSTGRVDDGWRFVTVTLLEPAKDVVQVFDPPGPMPRRAFAILTL